MGVTQRKTTEVTACYPALSGRGVFLARGCYRRLTPAVIDIASLQDASFGGHAVTALPFTHLRGFVVKTNLRSIVWPEYRLPFHLRRLRAKKTIH